MLRVRARTAHTCWYCFAIFRAAMWYVRQLALFLQFYFTSRSVRSLHSPSLFNLFTQVFTAAGDDAFYTDIEHYRTLLAASTHSVSGGDLGAGSRRQNRQRADS